ncbi:MFS transporter [Hyphomonas sp.]|uniref:MFS transporter n=1 Tax=Hyphomonas sp. TaxID=87 RepID=UPI0025C204D6|nr:MFS transporter [Hyphomonas sp.]
MTPPPSGTPDGAPGRKLLSRRELVLLAFAAAVVTANAYYIHPIIALVAQDFGVSHADIGLVPALNQIALALGIFVLLPLGDRFSNRQLATIFAAGQLIGLAVMALASDFWLFVAGSTFLGFSTITPYLLPAYASKRVLPQRLGQATATLTTGVIAGILVARVGAGWVGEHLGWRTVYYGAAGVMLLVTLLLPRIMEDRDKSEAEPPQQSHAALVLSVFPIIRQHPEVLLSGAIQGLGFGIFLAVWLGLGLHLTSPEMGYGADTVGYLAAISLLNLFTTPALGAWADRTGPRRARFIISLIQFCAVCLLGLFGHSLWLLVLPLIVMNLVGPLIDITGRMTFLTLPAAVRTRLMTAYIVLMFIGGGLASWAATWVYEHEGWDGTAMLAAGLSAMLVALSFFAMRTAPGRNKA